MIQAIGLTSLPRRHQQRPAVDDLTFEARPGRVTVLLGPQGSGKTTALRLLLQLQPGRGVALFRGRPVHRVPHLAREVGVLLGDVPGHPSRTARGHLRMLAAVAGVPVERADDVLDVVGLSGLADHRMGTFSRGMDRRLGVACALLGDPHTLVLDEPAHGLSPRETQWLHSMLRGYAKQGGAVLATSRGTEEAARLADRVVSIDSGRLVADQDATDFVRTRLRPRVAVRTPHAERLTAILTQEARRAGRTGRESGPLKVVLEGGSRVSVYGSSCAEVGEYAHRNGILVHQLTDESGDAGDAGSPGPLDRADGRRSATPPAIPATASSQVPSEVPSDETSRAASGQHSEPEPELDPELDPETGLELELEIQSEIEEIESESAAALVPATTSASSTEPSASAPATGAPPEATTLKISDSPLGGSSTQATAPTKLLPSNTVTAQSRPRPYWSPTRPPVRAAAQLPPELHEVPRPGPAAPLRYELRRLSGVRSTWITLAVAAFSALCIALVLARTGTDVRSASGSTLTPAMRLLTGWPSSSLFVLPPAAVAVGVLGALAFGQEFRYPALAPARSPVPRRLSLLAAKLFVSAALAIVLSLAVAAVNASMVTLFFGTGVLAAPAASSLPGGEDSPGAQVAAVLALTVGCAWAGVLAAGIFRSAVVGTGVVVAVPLIAPAVRELLGGSSGQSLEGLPGRLESALLVPWPPGAEHWVSAGLRLVSQSVGPALALSVAALLCAYVITAVRSRVR